MANSAWVGFGGGQTFLSDVDTPGAYTYGHVWVNEAQNALEFSNNFNPDVVPETPNALDDEFEGEGSIDVKWSYVNNPAAGDAFNQTTYPGFLRVNLNELAVADDFSNTVRIYQAPPTGTAAMTYIAKVSMALTAYGDRNGEFAGVGLYLGNLANEEFIGMTYRTVDTWGTQYPGQIVGQEDDGGGGFQATATVTQAYINHTEWLYLKLEKTTTNDYDGANTYNAYYSINGVTWTLCGTDTKTFTANCDELGLIFRRPVAQAGTPVVEALCDFFRRTV